VNRRRVSSYQRSDGTRVRGYSQRYEKGDLRAVSGGLSVAVLALVVAGFHVAGAVLELVAVVAVILAGGLVAAMGVRRRRRRRGGRRGGLMRSWRYRRVRRAPVRSRDGVLPRGRRMRVPGEEAERSGVFVRRGDTWSRVE
jgi:hypothetical protein